MSIESITHVFQSLEKHFTSAIPPSADTARESQQAQRQKDAPTASLGSVEAGLPYKLECRARYYDAASRILEEEGQLCTHDNTNELGALIEQWINDARNNWEPR